MSNEKPLTPAKTAYFKFDEFVTRLRNSKLWQFLRNFREIIVVLAFYIPYVASLLTGPQLTIHYELTDLPRPLNAVEAAKSVTERQNLEATEEIVKLARFVSSPQLLQVSIRNNTSKAIEHFQLTIERVEQLLDVGVSSDSQKMLRDARNIATTTLSEKRVLAFPELTNIPPFTSIELSVWGSIYPPMFREPLKVRADVDKTAIYKIGKATDLALFISDNQAILIGILLVLCSWLGIKRAMNRR